MDKDLRWKALDWAMTSRSAMDCFDAEDLIRRARLFEAYVLGDPIAARRADVIAQINKRVEGAAVAKAPGLSFEIAVSYSGDPPVLEDGSQVLGSSLVLAQLSETHERPALLSLLAVFVPHLSDALAQTPIRRLKLEVRPESTFQAPGCEERSSGL